MPGSSASGAPVIAAVPLRAWSTQSDFKIKEQLTKGSYGKVYSASHVNTGKDLIVKAVHKFAPRGPGELSPEEELALHHYVSKKMPDRLHVAKLIAGYEDEHHVYSVMEACHGPTIKAVLDVAHGPLPEEDAAFLLKEAATTIKQLHSIGVLHRDVKPDNFMFYKNDVTSPLVVIDFGLSLLLGSEKELQSKWTVGSLLYVAPEVTNRGLYTPKCDVWSLGILLYRMLFDHEPYSSFEEAADAAMLPLPDDARERISEEALELVGAMLKHDHNKRISVDGVLQHPFLQKSSTDIDDLIEAWRHARAEADDDSIPSMPLNESRHTSLVQDRSQRSASGISGAAGPPSVTASMSVPRRMPPSSLLSISPAAGEYESSSHSSSPGSRKSAEPSVPLDYPDLPSLTMPVSIRRAYSSAASLHAQARVQTLSAAADQSWHGGALMRPSALHEPVAADSDTRDEARAMQFARPQQGMLSALLGDPTEHPNSIKSVLTAAESYNASFAAGIPADLRNDAHCKTDSAHTSVADRSELETERAASASAGANALPVPSVGGSRVLMEAVEEAPTIESAESAGPFVVGSAPAQLHGPLGADGANNGAQLDGPCMSGMSPDTLSPATVRSMPGVGGTGAERALHMSFATAGQPDWCGLSQGGFTPQSSPPGHMTAMSRHASHSCYLAPPDAQAAVDRSPAHGCYLDAARQSSASLPDAATAADLRSRSSASTPQMQSGQTASTEGECPSVERRTSAHAQEADKATRPSNASPPTQPVLQPGPTLSLARVSQLSAEQRTSIDSRRILQSLLADRGQ